MTELTEADKRYLSAVLDWSAAWEVAVKFGWPESAGEKVKPKLGRLINRGLVTWAWQNATYRITPAGRAALNKDRSND